MLEWNSALGILITSVLASIVALSFVLIFLTLFRHRCSGKTLDEFLLKREKVIYFILGVCILLGPVPYLSNQGSFTFRRAFLIYREDSIISVIIAGAIIILWVLINNSTAIKRVVLIGLLHFLLKVYDRKPVASFVSSIGSDLGSNNFVAEEYANLKEVLKDDQLLTSCLETCKLEAPFAFTMSDNEESSILFEDGTVYPFDDRTGWDEQFSGIDYSSIPAETIEISNNYDDALEIIVCRRQFEEILVG